MPAHHVYDLQLRYAFQAACWSSAASVSQTGVVPTRLVSSPEAGVGDPGVDLANLRFQSAMHHGPDGPVLVLDVGCFAAHLVLPAF